MPSSSTTLPALEAAFAEQFRQIVPTISIERAAGWVHAADRRELAPSMVPRRYSIQWGEPTVVRGGATGQSDTEVGVVMRVVTDYRAFRKETLADVVHADHWDLHDRLADRLDPIIPGLWWIESQRPVVDDIDALVIAHEYVIQYIRAR